MEIKEALLKTCLDAFRDEWQVARHERQAQHAEAWSSKLQQQLQQTQQLRSQCRRFLNVATDSRSGALLKTSLSKVQHHGLEQRLTGLEAALATIAVLEPFNPKSPHRRSSI